MQVSDIVAKTPIQGHFGDLDNQKDFSDKDSGKRYSLPVSHLNVSSQFIISYIKVDVLEDKLKSAPGDKSYEIHRYENEGHGYMNHDEWTMDQYKKMGFPGDFNDKTRDLTWTRVTEFLKKYLY
jgi:hypothetical protein